jgi:hypothetical protein
MSLATIISIITITMALMGHVAFVSWKFGQYSQKQIFDSNQIDRLCNSESQRAILCAGQCQVVKNIIKELDRLVIQVTDSNHKTGILNDSLTKLSTKVETLEGHHD